MGDTLAGSTVFATLVRSTEERTRARLLIDSIRAFGGDQSRCPVWLFEADHDQVPCTELAGEGVLILPLSVADSTSHYLFSDKVTASAQAEAMSAGQTRSLVWIDPTCLIVNPPVLFDLGPAFDAAVRPVHIKNVGLGVTDPVDGYWANIYSLLGVQDIQSTVESFVDGQRLRAYFNTHAFAVNPSRGLLRCWAEHFESLVCDQAYQAACCRHIRHQVFLHQAVLSAILVTSLDPERIRILPSDYNYPYNLQESIPLDRRARSLDELVCVACEDRLLNPNVMYDIDVREPLRSWLSAHTDLDSSTVPARR